MVLPLLKTDLLTVMQAVENETLGDMTVEWHGGAAACVILASGGYPGMTLGPSGVIISPKYKQPLKGQPSARMAARVGRKMRSMHSAAASGV